MKFFLDNNLSPRFAEGLRAFLQRPDEHEIKHLSEKFANRSIEDEDWIRALGREGDWAIISADPRILRAKGELAAWQESRLTSFFFGGGWASLSYWNQVADLVRWWPMIVQATRDAPVGTGHMMHLKAKELKVLYPPYKDR